MNNTSVILYRINQQKKINSFQWEFDNTQTQEKVKERATAYFYTLDEAKFEKTLDDIQVYDYWEEELKKELPKANSILLIIKGNEPIILNHYDKEVLPKNIYCLYNNITNKINSLPILNENVSTIQDWTYILPFDAESSKQLDLFHESLSGFPNWEKDLLLEKLMMHDDKLNQWGKTKKWLIPLTLASSFAVAVLSITHIIPYIGKIVETVTPSPFTLALNKIEKDTVEIKDQFAKLTGKTKGISEKLTKYSPSVVKALSEIEKNSASDNADSLDDRLIGLKKTQSDLSLTLLEKIKADKKILEEAQVSLTSLNEQVKNLKISVTKLNQLASTSNAQEAESTQPRLKVINDDLAKIENEQKTTKQDLNRLNDKFKDIDSELKAALDKCKHSISEVNSEIGLNKI